MTQTLKLLAPIQAHGAETVELTFRDPIGADIIAHGYPIAIKSDGSTGNIAVDGAAMGAMIAALAGIPPSSVAKLDYRDFTRAAGVVTAFFLPILGDLYPSGT